MAAVGKSKPLTFLERARLAKKQNEESRTNVLTNKNARTLDEIKQQNDQARENSSERKQENLIRPTPNLSVPNTLDPT